MPVPLAIPLALGGVEFLKWLSINSANSAVTNKGMAALDKAQGAIQGAADKSVALQQPYLQNAAQDYAQRRGLVQSGYFQTPYSQLFTPQQYRPGGFSFNPGQGTASFTSQQGLLNSFTPQGLPPLPNLPTYQPPATPTPQGPSNPISLPHNPLDAIKAIQNLVTKPTPMTQPTKPAEAGPLANWNPQTGQGNPLEQMGFKPQDPRAVSLAQLFALKKAYPWIAGGSGPLEGGMPGRGLI